MTTELDPETKAELQEHVARGTALLDARKPGWAFHIDLVTLDMTSCYQCVLGQLYGRYSEGLERLDILDEGDWQHGFDAKTGTARRDVTEQIAEINRLWRDLVETRAHISDATAG